MQAAPFFQPALDSSRTVPQSQACDDGLTFAAHYPADDFAASLANGEAALELWTDLPISNLDHASASRTTAWKAIPLRPLKASAGRKSGFAFAATVQCSKDAADGAFGFTYRIVHPDGKIDWLGSPPNDGQIYLPSAHTAGSTIQQLIEPHLGTEFQLRRGSNSPLDADETIKVASLVPSRRTAPSNIAFSINASSVQSGLVIERTKSTWCTSRRFRSLTEVSPDYGSNLIVLELAQSSNSEILVILPAFDDDSASARLARGSCDGAQVDFQIIGAGAAQAKVSFALGTIATLKETIAACRSNAVKSLRTSIHEPLGLSWSAKKLLDSDSSLALDDMIPTIPYDYDEYDYTDTSFYSDSTIVDGSQQGLSRASSMIIPGTDSENLTQEDRDGDASTVNGDRTCQAEAPSSPPKPRAGLGFCTWEAMQNEQRLPYLSEVVAALEAAETRLGQGSIVSLLIDDGWQDVVHGAEDRGRLNSFDMNPAMFDLEDTHHTSQSDESVISSVLARYTSYIRARFPAIRSIGCWMTLAGYWDGIHPEGPIAAGLSAPLRHARVQDPYRHVARDWFVQSSELDMHLFWDRAFHTLRQSGVDFVKVDAQAEWEWMQDETTSEAFGSHTRTLRAAALGKAAFEAMEGAATRYFGAGNGVIHCMAFTSNLTNTLKTLPNQGMTIRCTDDFFPRIPEAHRHHLSHNVYNSLLLPEHSCDADMLSHCSQQGLSSESTVEGPDHTGYHASFRAFTDAGLWISDKADAPQHPSMRALVSPQTLSGDGARVCVQARGSLLHDAVFDDLVGDGPGPALKMTVQHEITSCATLGLWNLRGGDAATFDVLDVKQMLNKQGNVDQVSSLLYSQYAVRSFRSGKISLLSNEPSHDGQTNRLLNVSLAAGSWEVLTISPLLTTMIEGVRVAVLGSTEHFMTPGGVHAVSVVASYPDKESRRRSYLSHTRKPSHHRRRSTRSISSESASLLTAAAAANKDERALTKSSADKLMQRSDPAAQAVILSLALINGLFALLQSTMTGVVPGSRKGKGSIVPRKTAGVDVVDTVIGMLDKLQTLFVFGLLVLASWTLTLPEASSKRKSWLPFLDTKQIRATEESERLRPDDKTLRRVRLRPADAVATLKRCLESRTMMPLRQVPISMADPQPNAAPSAPLPLSPLPETPLTASVATTPDVVVSMLIDMAVKMSFLVLCSSRESIKTCRIERTRYDCASTPWIKIEEVELEEGSSTQDGSKAFRVEVDLKAWKQNQDETYVQTLSAPVSLSLRISSPI
ncbi:Glycosyl hydrolases 36 [Kalmanozyma brasiliensis GHG001]|uniref:Alpha-galactosidase n=1 Tax=Kalmanozyma brasiliensis (strain GHG001) TaxID=1365824 RepID=V5GVR4_KALBG|nr:Glycosyl hydrolases 36 [Kalmanozyma brasiliensis GHG001]EST09992.1 Glycosyl hydrolases 36 [Kalmanozyma brasiliensis GHG001]